jgi:heme exporter protein CcmD
MSSNHWHFVALSYAIFFILIMIDWGSSAFVQRRLERDLRARLRREQAQQNNNQSDLSP